MRRVRVGWRQLAGGLGIRYKNCPSDDDVLAAAKERGLVWARAFEMAAGEILAPEEASALQVEAEDILRCHWSPEAVLPSFLNVAALVSSVNSICRASSDVRTMNGDGIISWSEDPSGVRFSVAIPLVCGYALVRASKGLPDGETQLGDIGTDQMLLIMRHAVGELVLDVSGWELEIEDPEPHEVVGFVSRRRSRLAREARAQVSGQHHSDGASSRPERIAR